MRFLNRAFLDPNSLRQRVTKTIDDPAFGLRHDIIRLLHAKCGINDAPEVVHFDDAGRFIDGNFRDRREKGPAILYEAETLGPPV